MWERGRNHFHVLQLHMLKKLFYFFFSPSAEREKRLKRLFSPRSLSLFWVVCPNRHRHIGRCVVMDNEFPDGFFLSIHHGVVHFRWHGEVRWAGWNLQRCSYLGNEPGLLHLASSLFPAQAQVKNYGVNKQSCLFLYAHSPLPADGGGAIHPSARNWLASRPAALLHDSQAVAKERWRRCENGMGALAPKQLLRYSNGSEQPATRVRVEIDPGKAVPGQAPIILLEGFQGLACHDVI